MWQPLKKPYAERKEHHYEHWKHHWHRIRRSNLNRGLQVRHQSQERHPQTVDWFGAGVHYPRSLV